MILSIGLDAAEQAMALPARAGSKVKRVLNPGSSAIAECQGPEAHDLQRVAVTSYDQSVKPASGIYNRDR